MGGLLPEGDGLKLGGEEGKAGGGLKVDGEVGGGERAVGGLDGVAGIAAGK